MELQAILGIIAGIEAALAAAPQAIEIATKGKDLITALFTANLITKDMQDTLHENIDARAKLFAAGIIPDALKVEPDPQ